MRRSIAGLVIALVALGATTAASAQATKRLTVAVNFSMTDSTFVALQGLAAAYNRQTSGVSVEVVTYPRYEEAMKTKMAANDLPDLWTTHGWSVARYSEYLEPLNRQPWASLVNPTIKGVITDKAGKFFVLPFDMEVAGVAFNRGVLDQARVDPAAIKTWDDFKAACARVKAIGKIPVHIGGSAQDDWTVGNFYDWTAPSFLITNDRGNARKTLKDGSFDWKLWAPVARLLVDFRDAGYLNPDYTQGTWADVSKKLASGDVAFAFFGNYVIGEAKKQNPAGEYGFMPVPAASTADSPTVITGERVALGVWRDGKNKKEALKFLAFCARPENVSAIATINGNPTGLVGAGYASDLGDLTPYFDRLKGIRGFPYFDREYLPSGMWDSLCKTGTGLLANTMTIDQAVSKMKSDYESLR
ncbi:MAG: extracellular solute-binding protein [Spirochaetes bacterium]|nr:extracellular solute-binding protein [Spirochaetota bacterium]MBU1079528.1 extracellular solute-binding protein [Spirochaetota bacterium]